MPPKLSQRETLLRFRPPLLVERASDPPAPVPSPPLQLLDRHISANLTLKRVELLPSIANDLCHVVNTYSDNLSSLRGNWFGFSNIHYNDPTDRHAHKTLYVRSNGISNVCCRLASNIILHPKSPAMNALFSWLQHGKLLQYGPVNDGFVQHSVLHIRDFVNIPGMKELLEPFDEETRSQLTVLLNHSPFLMVGSFFSPSAHRMLEDMDRLTEHPFPWRLSSRCKMQPSEKKCAPDATTTLWDVPSNRAALRRSSRLSERRTGTYHVPNPGSITVNEPEDTDSMSLTGDFIQKAWSNAVHLDTSLIVFDCGNFMRIGIRHRAQQTLYLSTLIDVQSDDPVHGQLWLGLHISAAFDALQRLPLLTTLKADSDIPRPLKRNRTDSDLDTTEMTSAKRARLRLKKEQRTDKLFSSSAAIIAIFFQWRDYDSPTPLILWPPGSDVRQKYKEKECLRVVIHDKLGSGGTGDVYSAKVHGPGKTDHSPCVVKIASKPDKLVRLRQEHRVYAHLGKSGVTGIPTMLGFYENRQDGISALMLSNAGLPIALQMDAQNQIHLKDTEITALKTTLDRIHEAGILHRDIRSWNILSDDDGRIYVTDFDRSSFSGTEQEFTEEKKRLAQLTVGEFVDDKGLIGAADPMALLLN